MAFESLATHWGYSCEQNIYDSCLHWLITLWGYPLDYALIGD